MKKLLSILISYFLISNSLACINEYRTLLDGTVVFYEPYSGKIWEADIDTSILKEASKKLLASYKETQEIEFYSDYAAGLIYLGEYLQAKKIYEEIEAIKPNLYTTASNLGTIYELIGKPDSALLWIKKSMDLNPDSHKGSEWIHIKILEFQISGSKNYNQSILGLDFGNKVLPSNINQYDLEELEKHIQHQLIERTVFVKPENLIVGNIYFDYGNVLSQTKDVQTALESYKAAKEYGFESELMEQRILEFEELALKAKPNQLNHDTKNYITKNINIFLIGFILSILVLVSLVLYLILKRNRSKKQ